MLVRAPGISIDLPAGWEAEVDGGAGAGAPGSGPSRLRTPRTHIANFGLPSARGDFGSNAVEHMRRGDALVCLLEEDPTAAGSRLHRVEGLPVLVPGDFDSNALQRVRPGQSGTQVFFHAHERAFVLYVVLADPTQRDGLVREVNDVLAGITIHR